MSTYQRGKSQTSVLQNVFEVRGEYEGVRGVRQSRFSPLVITKISKKFLYVGYGWF